MGPLAQKAIDAWNHEVDAEIASLVEGGVPPLEAAQRAAERVSERRRVSDAQDAADRLRDALAAATQRG